MSTLDSTELSNRFYQLFNYKFNDVSLLELALTHRSFSKLNNERLEFLGDSILNCTIAAQLYKQFPDVTEGDLSRLRSSLVDKQSLAKLAKQYDYGKYLKLGGGELKTGGWRRDSILADAMEAIFGAVYLDAGVQVAQEFILNVYHSLLQDVPTLEELKDSKTQLQEFLQARKLPIPVYSIVSVTGKPHEQQFTVVCCIDEYDMKEEAKGTSRRKAEQSAAKKALSKLIDQVNETNK